MKSGIITVDQTTGAATLEATGVIASITGGITSVFSTTKAPTGYAAIAQRAALFTAGHVHGRFVETGKVGIRITGSSNPLLGQ